MSEGACSTRPHILRILLYCGSHSPTLDIGLNYAILAVTTVVGTMLFLTRRGRGNVMEKGLKLWAASSGFFAMFQIVLCLSLPPEAGCTGISIIWSAQVGALWSWRRAHVFHVSGSEDRPLAIVSAFAIALWAYYAVVEDALTTVAHAAAAVMGALVAGFTRSLVSTTEDRRA